jgi:hypothetical protein
MTSRSSLAPVAEPLRLPAGRPLAAPGERTAAEAVLAARREEARAWLASRGITGPRAVYGAPPDA